MKTNRRPIQRTITLEQFGNKYTIKIGRNTNDELYQVISPNAPTEVREMFAVLFDFFYKQEV
jgi:hypothetical protein